MKKALAERKTGTEFKITGAGKWKSHWGRTCHSNGIGKMELQLGRAHSKG